MGRLIEGARAYYLQAYKESEDIIMPGLSGYTKAEMEEMKELAAPFVKKVELRGID
jgi:pyruvate formate lyase activating enzyme